MEASSLTTHEGGVTIKEARASDLKLEAHSEGGHILGEHSVLALTVQENDSVGTRLLEFRAAWASTPPWTRMTLKRGFH